MLRFWTRHRLTCQPFPAAWREILTCSLPLYRRLPDAERHTLEGRIQVFLAEKNFEGGCGLEVTEAMRVTIAGYACLLLLQVPAGYYPQLGTVVLYPENFAAPVRRIDDDGIVMETVEERLGESWQEGTVVLSWESIDELICGRDGDCNVIVHEFAHQIDDRRRLTAAPRLLTGSSRHRDWQELLTSVQERQRRVRRRGRPAVLDPYAITGKEELFAVASETFFMRPIRLKANFPEIYAELTRVYGVNPAEWLLGSVS